MGTGRAKEIPSSERKRTCPRVKREALVKPSCMKGDWVGWEERDQENSSWIEEERKRKRKNN